MSVYLRAAKRIKTYAGPHRMKDDCFCCPALSGSRATMANMSAFADAFKPEDGPSLWWGHCACWAHDNEPNQQQARVLALLFMHWMTVNP